MEALQKQMSNQTTAMEESQRSQTKHLEMQLHQKTEAIQQHSLELQNQKNEITQLQEQLKQAACQPVVQTDATLQKENNTLRNQLSGKEKVRI